MLNSINDLYKKLEKEYKLEWIKEGKDAFYLYFISDTQKYYRIYVDENYIGTAVKKKMFLLEYWSDIEHDHYNNKEDTFEDLYKGVMETIKKYNGHMKEMLEREYKVLEFDGRKRVSVVFKMKNAETLNSFFNFEVINFHNNIITMIDNVLNGKLSKDVFSGNCSYLEITPTVTKIYDKYAESKNGEDEDEAFKKSCCEVNTKELKELVNEYWNEVKKIRSNDK